ncbi:MAG: metal ABC transporter substrate-binding protein, partial [bacterium]
NVVTSIPDLADMALNIGGEHIKVISLATGREDLHAVPVRPSFLPKINRADLLLNLGMEAEHAWLNALAGEARNPRVMYKREGWIEVYPGITILDRPERWDRAEGHQHPLGNPHYNVGPQCGKIMAQNIAQAFIASDPANKAYYQENLTKYLVKLESMEKTLKEKGSALKGISVFSYHSDVIYLCDFYGMQKIGSLEPKPGIQPTATHMAFLAEEAKKYNVKFILYNQAQNGKLPEKLAKECGVRAVQFANAVGAKGKIKTWIELQEYNLDALLQGLWEAK